MLQVIKVLQQDLATDINLKLLVYITVLNIQPEYSVLSQHYSSKKFASFLVNTPDIIHYILYLDSKPIGIQSIAYQDSINLDCLTAQDLLLYIKPEYRSLKNINTLTKFTIKDIANSIDEVCLLCAGSTLGKSTAIFYERLGFTSVGTQLVLEIQPKKESNE
jgi:hypothetical protein